MARGSECSNRYDNLQLCFSPSSGIFLNTTPHILLFFKRFYFVDQILMHKAIILALLAAVWLRI